MRTLKVAHKFLFGIALVMLVGGFGYLWLVYGTDYGNTMVRQVDWATPLTAGKPSECFSIIHDNGNYFHMKVATLCYVPDEAAHAGTLTYTNSTEPLLIRVLMNRTSINDGKVTPIASVTLRSSDTVTFGFIIDNQPVTYTVRLLVLKSAFLQFEPIAGFMLFIGFPLTLAMSILIIRDELKHRRNRKVPNDTEPKR